MSAPAIVVGAGMATALGLGVRATFDGLIAGRTGIRRIRRFDPEGLPVRFGAEIDAFPGLSGPDLYDALLDAVLAEALDGVDLGGIAPGRIGVFVGAEAVRPEVADMAEQLRHPSRPDPAEIGRYHPARQANRVADRVGATGPVTTLSIACTSSAQAVGDALAALRRGEVDVALAGGVDVLVHPLMVLGFSRLGALSSRNDAPERASRPFDRARDGFVLGDGAGMVVLAREGTRVGPELGRITGYASTCNAWRITDTPPDGRGTRVGLVEALRDAGRSPGDVAYINAHGTSTPQNDASEARGLCDALGAAAGRIPVSSTKSAMGHTVAACGVIEATIALFAVREGVAPPTLNLDDPDPDCPVCHVPNAPVRLEGRVAVSNAAGFGGSNTSLVVEAP